MRFTRIAGLVALAFFFATPAHAVYKVDVHAHATVGTGACPAVDELIAAMDGEALDVMILMSTPHSLVIGGEEATTDLERCFPSATYGSRIKFMYGGQELNTLLHAAGRHESVPSSDRWDPDDPLVGLYPNGCPALDCTPLEPGIETAIDIETDVTSASPTNEYYDQFVALAEAAAASGRYLGFGEIGALHYSQREGHPYVHFPANHAWMKKLVDIAAAAPSRMVIDLHLEIDATSQAELEDLLAHDRSVNIVLEHAGWSTYGGATAATLSMLMAGNSNLYLALKKCQHDSVVTLDACYLDVDHSVKSEWVTLLSTYASRIMIGTDAKYWRDGGTTSVSDTMSDGRRPDLQTLMHYFIGTATRMAIQGGTARRLFRLP